MAAELPRFAFAACVDRLLDKKMRSMKQPSWWCRSTINEQKRLAKLQRREVGSVPAMRAECLSQTVGKARTAAPAFCEISTSVVSRVTET
ncbi:hypothetical protein ACN2CC_14010 [Mesorhizobium muleiense]|uniref:hypothetical protein n=1 Tax=Mesorhizobium muleiense TaxID=1004279 RepID=UPI003AFA0D9B